MPCEVMAYFKRDELVKLAKHMKIVVPNKRSATLKTGIMEVVKSTTISKEPYT